MFAAAVASGPKTRKAGSGMPTSHNFAHNSVVENSLVADVTQHWSAVPRIIATHWLRSDSHSWADHDPYFPASVEAGLPAWEEAA